MNKEYLMDSLLAGPAYTDYSPESEKFFLQALGEEIKHNAQGNSEYAAFLKRNGYDFESEILSLDQVPYIPVQVFKALGPRLFSIPEDEIYTSLSSSATSGQASTVVIDKITAKRQRKAMMKVMTEVLGPHRKPFFIFDIAPYDKAASLNARSAAIRGYMNFSTESKFFIDDSPEGLIFKSDAFRDTAIAQDQPVVLCAFTYVLYGSVIRAAKKQGLKYQLPGGSQIIHIGGWKKLESEKVSRDIFLKDAAEVFGIDPLKIHDIYGFTEQMGLNYPDCPCGFKHTPAFSRLLVRAPENHKVLPAGEEGVLEFISPLPHSYPGNAVLTDDLGFINSEPCPFGRGGTRFQVVGRLKKSEIRGCGDIMGNKMKTAASWRTDPVETLKTFRSQHFADGEQPQTLGQALEQLRESHNWLRCQPLEGLIGLIHSVAQSWLNNDQLSPWRHQGLAFLARWCQGDNLRQLASEGLSGQPGALDDFCRRPNRPGQLFKAYPKGMVCHWLAGNVPLLGMLALVQAIITKNVNAMKVASNNTEALDMLLGTFAGRQYRTRSGHTVNGDDLLKTILLVYYNHQDQEQAVTLSSAADVRIAWGGREAIEAICALPSSAGCEDVIFGPKLSFMVVAKEALANERAAKKILRRAATDISSFDQQACASPHTIFVEEGGALNAAEFAAQLGPYLEKALYLIPKAPEDQDTINAIQTARAVGYFMGECHHSEGAAWTVLYDERLALATPVYSRVISIKPVRDIIEAADLVHQDIQTIGLAAKGIKRLKFAEKAASRGALRFPEIGRMTNFDSPWDGLTLIEKLTRVVTLGGPML